MPKPNYQFEKRKRDMEKKAKKDEKARRKKETSQGGAAATPEGADPVTE